MALRNKRGQVAVLGLMIGILVFFAAMAFLPALTSVISTARSPAQLDCSNASISDGQKATCLIVDISLPVFIGTVIGLAGAYITAKYIV
jgi:hypothetical protein